MDHSHFMSPDDETLVRFALDGEALPEEASRHLEQCETCQKRVAEYKDVNAFLVSRLYRRRCPTGSQLSLYCADLLSADERIGIANHLLDCPLCAEEVAVTRSLLAEPLLPPLASFSPAATIRRIFGTLVRQQAQLVLRDEEPVATWPLQYRAESIGLSLHISRASNGEYVLLVILTDSVESADTFGVFEGIVAELYRAPGPLTIGSKGNNGNRRSEMPLLHTQVDDIGNIVFSGVPVGEYVLIIYLPEREVVIERLTIEKE